MLLLSLLVLAAGGPVAETVPFDEAAWRAAIEANRAKTTSWLTQSPTSYYAAVARTDFGSDTSIVVGSAADAQLRIADPAISPHHLRITVVGDAFRVEAIDANATFSTKEGPQRAATVPPSTLQVGRFTLRLAHQGFPAVVLFDAKALEHTPPERPEWWAIDPAYRVVATLVAEETPREVVIQSTRGHKRRGLKLGRLQFELKGKALALEADRLLEPGVSETAISVFFRDATTGKGSYPVGRYLDPVKLPDGRYLLDFNTAYNPACAFSPHYNCPIPPRENVLPVPVEAGEKAPRAP